MVSCKSNQVQSETSSASQEAEATPETTPMEIIDPVRVNPDDCRLTIRITEIGDELIGGTITNIIERGFGFKDYINVGDSREFKPLNAPTGLKKDMVVTGTIRTIGNSRDAIYTLKNIEINK